jgi:hypothetical protein
MDFTNPNTMRDCWIVNDSVMGGLSQSSLRKDPHGMFFEGQVSLENNGGFASMRSSVRFPHGTQLIELLAKGDSKRYKLVLNQFKATFRGQAVHAPTLSFSDVTEFGILISNSQAGSFAIQLKTLQST